MKYLSAYLKVKQLYSDKQIKRESNLKHANCVLDFCTSVITLIVLIMRIIITQVYIRMILNNDYFIFV